MKMIKKQFPTCYDVEQTLTYRNTSYADLKEFMQSKGLINVGMGKDHITEFAVNILFEHKDYIFMRKLAQGGAYSVNISGFNLRFSTAMPIACKTLKEDIEEFRKKLINQEKDNPKKRGAPTQKLSSPIIGEDNIIKTTFEYQRLIPGKVELMQRVDTTVDFIIEPISEENWRVVCYPQANQDVKKIEKIFEKLGNTKYNPFTISLENFTQKQRIQFFDEILDYYNNHNIWKFEEVVEISIRQLTETDKKMFICEDEDSDTDEYIDEYKEVFEELGEDDLLSITNAVLQGHNLRTNSFVQKCQNQGFYFPSMSLLLKNKKTPERIQVTICFKLSPKMFQVVLESTEEDTETGIKSKEFSSSRQQEILREFWNTSHNIWHKINNEVPEKGEQLKF